MAKLATPIAALVLVWLTIMYGELDYLDRGTAMFGSIAIMVIGASAVVIGISSEKSRFSGPLRSGFLRFFGRYSYAIYIVHTAILRFYMDHYCSIRVASDDRRLRPSRPRRYG